MLRYLPPIFFILISCTASSQNKLPVLWTEADSGWASNSINAVVFRKNSLVTYKDTQYIAFYNKDQFVVLGKRKSGDSKWELAQTLYKGNTKDAHNTISIMVDGEGYLHLSWDHHNNQLRYCKSVEPGSLEMTDKIPMTRKGESSVSYPEFYKLANGDLLFLYRDGGSGRGNLVINKYSIATKEWKQLHSNLIDGEGKRNAYWQACSDNKGTIHISWVWRESPDVSSNHDMCYARSKDGGITWEKSTNEKYQLPITLATAEYAFHIAEKSELINQTSMAADAAGNPYIASYWRDSSSLVPQYRVIYKTNGQWQAQNLGFRKTPFSLNGGGTKRIPIARPQLIVWNTSKTASVALLFRDAERKNKVSVAINKNIDSHKWNLYDLTTTSVGSWEPSYDSELWKEKQIVNLFVQNVEQVDGEGIAVHPPQMIRVLEWSPTYQKKDN